MRALRIVLGVALAVAACTTFSETTTPETSDAGGGTDAGTDGSDAGTDDATITEDAAIDTKQGTLDEYRAAVLLDGPQAYWRMVDPAGSDRAQDSIGSNPAYLSPTTRPVFGNPGLFPGSGSLTFDGKSFSYAYVTGSLPIDNIALTFEAWIRLENAADSEYRHIAFVGSTTLSYGIYVHDGAGFGVARITSSPSATKTFRQTSAPPSTKEWHHVVATWDGTALALYVDDKIAANGTTQDAGSPSTSLLYVGAKSASDLSLPSGARLAEVAVYASALPASRVHAHYVLGKP